MRYIDSPMYCYIPTDKAHQFVSLDLLICKGCQQTTPAGKELNKFDINSKSDYFRLVLYYFYLHAYLNSRMSKLVKLEQMQFTVLSTIELSSTYL